MSFKKGHSGNPEGRPAGAKNKVTEDIRERISEFISDNWQQVKNDYQALDPEKRLLFFEKLLKYSIAPLQSISMQAEIKRELDSLSNEDLETLVNKLLSKTNTDNE